MEEQKYLIAIALAEQNNKRLMPLGGKTYSGIDSKNEPPSKETEKILLDLLLRLFKRTNEGNLKISNDETGLLVAEISFESMQNNLPIIKSDWINTGNTDTLIDKLKSISSNLWSVKYKKHEGIMFNDLINKKLS
ncbi:hypothetical protein [Prochlorococcus marinus]|uniref:Uncharacterized protein n=1 Tax=Prochlorococcus marinus XMU1408 TaxID=2213228 RepID=A0A318R5D0_PROMR|nr:hypothetical protein [Prochlorococcus marinus]MBW3041861.1 hypothetical protein [Prochlorococcus marinus str. XMU1408]PYE02998.1 hypothetical protein DNJ73_04425 [Prochlorococcus marinus XMU1408]